VTGELCELAVLGALAAARVDLDAAGLSELVARAASPAPADLEPTIDRLIAAGLVARRGARLALAPAGLAALLERYQTMLSLLDPSPPRPDRQDCPSLPWLTTVKTCWKEAVSINYAVEPGALARLLPAPLEPEIHKGSGWIQVLMSSLTDLRPQGVRALFGVCFYQVSYRAAVVYTSASGERRRGGYFVRSETNHPIMRAVGNALTEFRFHDFGAADVLMLQAGHDLTLGVDPCAERPGGRIFGVLDTRPLPGPPPGSVWRSLEDLHEPLVECYDALGVDREAGFLYVLTIDRDPWRARFVDQRQFYCELVEDGALAGAARLDSILHLRDCNYRWRPLRREPL
jgi:uncharacterized protein YqjF (DUF2071 family)